MSEALALTADRVDLPASVLVSRLSPWSRVTGWRVVHAVMGGRGSLAAGVLMFATLKKRRAGIYRAVPVSPALLDVLDLVHGIRELQSRHGKGRGLCLWPRSRK